MHGPPVRTCVEVVPCSRSIEPVAEEIRKDLAGEALRRAPFVLDVRPQRRVLGKAGNLGERVANREEDAVHLRVLVYTDESRQSVMCKYECRSQAEARGPGHSPINMSAFGTL